MVSGAGDIEGDLRVALLTGASGWRDRNSSYDRVELATAAILLVLVVAVVAVLLMSAGLPGRDAGIDGAARWAVAGVATVTLVIAILPSLAWPLGWRPRQPRPARRLWSTLSGRQGSQGHGQEPERAREPRTVRPFAAVRVGAAMVVVGCWTALLGPVSPAPVWVLGGVIGCEYVLTAWALGVRTSGFTWWWRFQRSSVHLGILLLTAGVAVAYPARLGDLVKVPLSFQVMALGAALACHGLEKLREVLDGQSEQDARVVAAKVHGRLAHWLHDDVTSSLRLLRFRLQSGDLSPVELGAELDQLDHQIRLRQLDELLAADTAQVMHIVQPYIRLAQDQGVDVVEVPSSDKAAISLEGEMGYLMKRALGVLVPNALAAGASELAFRVEAADAARANDEASGEGEPPCITIEVEDNAGGFDLETVPAGRGLDGLKRDLGSRQLTRVPIPGGSRLRVVITPGRLNR